MRAFFAALLVIIMAGSIQSCKEGCKDKSALNYDSKATVENGTCMYCKDGYSADTAVYFFSISDSSSGTGTTANNVELIVVTTNSSIAGNGCVTVGKRVSNSCKNYMSMVNLTNKHVEGFIEVEFLQNGNQGWFFENQQEFVMGPPGSGTDTLNFGLVDTTTCSNLTTGTMSFINEQLTFF
jgi:hypothetical protein